MTLFLFDMAPVGGLIGAAAGVVFFLVATAVAAFAFFFLRRSVKTAVRLIVVGAILLIAAVGSLGLMYLGYLSSERPRPGPPPHVRTR